MSVNSGIQFPTPRLPKSHSLRKVSSGGNVANAISHRQIPSYPPLRIEQILRLIENGSSDAITVLEWLNVFRSELFFENDKEGYKAASLIWRAISENERLSRIALYLAGLRINAQNDKFPNLLIDSMSIARSFLKGKSRERVSWLTALRNKDFDACIKFSREINQTPLETPLYLNLPQVTSSRSDLYDALVSLIPNTLDGTNKKWFIKALEQTTRTELIGIIDKIISLGLQDFVILLDWIESHCYPSSNHSLWFELSDLSRQKLNKLFKLSTFFVLQDFAEKITNSSENVDDAESRNLISRVRFWSNYSEKIGRMRFIFPLGLDVENRLNLTSDEVDYLISDDSSVDGDNTVCLFELESLIVAVTLTGRASEIRFFDNNSRNQNRLFKNPNLTLTEIRRMTCLQLHDHVTLWQYFCERILKTSYGISPNSGVDYFNGMRKAYGKYDSEKGLPKPGKTLIKKREEHLEAWMAAFRSREKELEMSNSTSALFELQHAKLLKLRGETSKYKSTLKQATSLGNLEAKYLFAQEVLTLKHPHKSEKMQAESLLIEAAVGDYTPAVSLCEQLKISYKKSPPKLQKTQLDSLNKSLKKKSNDTPKSVKGSYARSKVNEKDERPYKALWIDDLEALAEAGLTEFERLNLLKELDKRSLSPRVKKLIEKLKEA